MAAICNYTEEEQWPRLNHRVGKDNEPSLMIWKHPDHPTNNITDTDKITKDITISIEDIKKNHPNKTLYVVINIVSQDVMMPSISTYDKFLMTLASTFTKNDTYNAYIDPSDILKAALEDKCFYENHLCNTKEKLENLTNNQKTYITRCNEGNFCISHSNDTNTCVTHTDIKEKIKQHTQTKDLHTILVFPFPYYGEYDKINNHVKTILAQYWRNKNTIGKIYTDLCNDTKKNDVYNSQTVDFTQETTKSVTKNFKKEKDPTENFEAAWAEKEINNSQSGNITDEKAEEKDKFDEFENTRECEFDEEINYWQMIIQKICDNRTFIGAGFGIILVGGIAAYLFLRHKA
jgi:hypothetical protein